MSNQMILWGTLLIPWLSLIFVPRNDIKRFMATGLFTLVLSTIACEAGVANGWWHFRETTYPLALLPTYNYGLYPIVPIWILKYTYGRFWRYFAAEVIANIAFIYIFLGWMETRGVIDIPGKLIAFVLTMVIALLLYGYQMWQEGILQPAASNR
jgi:hypothetical protein